ncbi:MAG: hypothetical protein IPI18_03870 [Saprospiraceae bacterium]|nr:hypothetical protein [Saprospiraceae bacterium]
MKLKSLIYLFLWIPLIFLQCQKDGLTGGDDNNAGTQNITYGKNRFITRIDGDDREYWVHIPNSYTGKLKCLWYLCYTAPVVKEKSFIIINDGEKWVMPKISSPSILHPGDIVSIPMEKPRQSRSGTRYLIVNGLIVMDKNREMILNF